MKTKTARASLALLLALGVLLGSADAARACSRTWRTKLLDIYQADAIVRVTALEYAAPPAPSSSWTNAIPESTVRFRVEEVLRGSPFPAELVFQGLLEDQDDFNDRPLPYRSVRRGGRSGSCFANSYRPGAGYLLFLRKDYDGYTPYWNALMPVNEQVRGADDPWVDWVRAYLSPCVAPGGRGAELGELPRAEMQAMEERPGSDLDRYRLAKCWVARFGEGGSRGERHRRTVDGFELAPPGE